jgi:MFS family permease
MRRRGVVIAIGMSQVLAFGSTYYLPAVLGTSIARETGWPLAIVIGGLSLAMLVSGLVASRVGHLIHRHGGRWILACGMVIIACGLIGIGLAPNLPIYLAGWAVIGVGMAASLYDAAFSTLARLYGSSARSAISWVTLFGGFASTVCWPLSAALVDAYGWRATCFIYAAIYAFLAAPALAMVVPKAPTVEPEERLSVAKPTFSPAQRTTFLLLAAILTVASLISSTLAVHLLAVLQLGGFDLAAAVALGTILGPAQVAGRLAELAFGRNHHPIWAMVVSIGLMAAGLLLLALAMPLAALALLLYGGGNGIQTIARGALPLSLFGPERYAIIMGWLATPGLIAQALAPAAAALLLEGGGQSALLAMIVAAALINIGLVAMLFGRARRAV